MEGKSDKVDSQLRLVGGRVREIRTVLEISTAEMAKVTCVPEDEYIAHEAGEVDSSFTFLYRCAERFGVDISALISGETPKLTFYTLTRHGSGMPIKRREEFEYRHLAPRLKNRLAEPFIVRAKSQKEGQPISLTTHGGQEFNYVLKGKLKVQLGDKIEILEPGDSIFYDSSHPHGMVAVEGESCEFMAMVIPGSHGTAEVPQPVKILSAAPAASGEKKLLYHNFMEETLDAEGHLQKVKFHYPENFNFAYDVLDAMERKAPEKTAMVWVDHERKCRKFSFADLARASRQVANCLASHGIGKGDKVMLVLRRHYEFWMTITALHRLGAIAVPASNQLTAHDFEYRFRAAGIKAIVAVDDEHIADYIEDASRMVPEPPLKFLVGGKRSTWFDLEQEQAQQSSIRPRPEGQKATDPMLMFFSSGTSGMPKMVLHNYTYPLGHIITARWWQHVDPEGLHFTISDTGWGKSVWGKLYGQWLCESAILTYDFDRFQAADILSMFSEYHVTTFCAPPTMYRFFIRENLENYDLSSLKHACIAGEALNPEVFQIFYKATGLKLMEGFGQTETTLTIANLIGMNPKPGSMGKPSPAYQIEVVDPDDKPVKPGEVGEIVIRAERDQVCGMFHGYYDDDEKTQDSWRSGLYHTGDTAWFDEDGYFWYVGRTDDVIKSSGYRIGPFEIESVLMELPYVLECAVIGVPDPTRGQVVKAFIVLTRGTVGSEELVKEIQLFVKTHTAPYKYPRQIEFVESLPKTTSGKIRRIALREMSRKTQN